jgi:hypothetical protein
MAQLDMDAERPPVDQSVLALSVARIAFDKVRVETPAGMAKPDADALVALVEKELLRHQIRIVTGQAKDAGAGALPAEAVLQITEWKWTNSPVDMRFFALDKSEGEEGYRELSSRAEYDAVKDFKIAFPSTELVFVGRFINAMTGESIATLEVKSAANWNLPQRYVATVENRGDRPRIVKESFDYAGTAWLAEAKRATEETVIRTVCERISRLDEGQILPPKAEDARPESVTREDLPADGTTAAGDKREPAKAAPQPRPATEPPPPMLPPKD